MIDLRLRYKEHDLVETNFAFLGSLVPRPYELIGVLLIINFLPQILAFKLGENLQKLAKFLKIAKILFL